MKEGLWWDHSWNPVSGCSHSGSPGCDNCWAKRFAYRLKGRFGYPKDDPFRVTFHPERLEEPLHWKKPKRVFVCSMGDLFHPKVESEWIMCVINQMPRAPQHTFLVLTKRPERMSILLKDRGLNKNPDNLWLGISCENQRTADERITILLQIPAAKRFVSVEPMLGPVLLDLQQLKYPNPGDKHIKPLVRNKEIDWVICGGETGPKARPMRPDWVRSVRDQCQESGVPFFFKSWGEWLPVGQKSFSEFKPIGLHDALKRFNIWSDREVSMKVGKKAAGWNIDNREWNEMP